MKKYIMGPNGNRGF